MANVFAQPFHPPTLRNLQSYTDIVDFDAGHIREIKIAGTAIGWLVRDSTNAYWEAHCVVPRAWVVAMEEEIANRDYTCRHELFNKIPQIKSVDSDKNIFRWDYPFIDHIKSTGNITNVIEDIWSVWNLSQKHPVPY